MFEELLAAARNVGYLARPLPLFYALSQAGRAIVAAHGALPESGGHGLKQDMITSPITETTIQATGHGLFAAMRAAVTSVRVNKDEPVELGAVWAAIPDLAEALPIDLAWPAAAFVEKDTSGVTVAHLDDARVIVEFPAAQLLEAKSDPETVLRSYPRARNLWATTVQGNAFPPAVILQGTRGPGIACAFEERNTAGEPVRNLALYGALDEHRYRGEYWLIPKVEALADDELPVLLLWWVLLFGLSILARYEPATWRAALDPVSSPLAVPLEALLDEALVAAPHWIWFALERGRSDLRLSRPG